VSLVEVSWISDRIPVKILEECFILKFFITLQTTVKFFNNPEEKQMTPAIWIYFAEMSLNFHHASVINYRFIMTGLV
jgi:hypothetical protein